MKVAVITCYKDPDYVRARSIRSGLSMIPDVELIVVKNASSGFKRYIEVLRDVWRVKRELKPDVFLLTFRGQEILPFVQLLIGKTPLIFDEFLVPLAWATNEHRAITLKNLVMMSLSRLSAPFYKSWLDKCSLILTDTEAHARLSSELARLPLSHYQVVPVSTDESVFAPMPEKTSNNNDAFNVFFYGNMLPLHGLQYVLEATEWLAEESQISFTIIGGGDKALQAVQSSLKRGAHIRYLPWVAFEKLPKEIANADICLGGPFGNTPQAKRVITGKTFQFIAMSKPTIVGSSPMMSEFIDKENALVVPQADAEAMADAIKWSADNRKELIKIGKAGHKLYLRQYSNKVVAKDLVLALRATTAD